MIVTMSDTTSSEVGSRLAELRETGGVSALGRVLTLIVSILSEDHTEWAVRAANRASREHPCRILVVTPPRTGKDRLDAQIRVGGDAGASEVVLLRPFGDVLADSDTLLYPLLLPDAPIVTWWTGAPEGRPADSPLGKMAQRRITDVINSPNPDAALRELEPGYTAGDTDLSWARTTLWRGLLAAALDEPPAEEVTSVHVVGGLTRPAVQLLAGWLAERLRVPVSIAFDDTDAITEVHLERPTTPISLRREPGTSVAVLRRPGRGDQHINLPLRRMEDCLSEELRRLDGDAVYGAVISEGLCLLDRASNGT